MKLGESASITLSRFSWTVVCGFSGLLGIGLLTVLGWLLITAHTNAKAMTGIKEVQNGIKEVQVSQEKNMGRLADKVDRIAERMWENE